MLLYLPCYGPFEARYYTIQLFNGRILERMWPLPHGFYRHNAGIVGYEWVSAYTISPLKTESDDNATRRLRLACA